MHPETRATLPPLIVLLLWLSVAMLFVWNEANGAELMRVWVKDTGSMEGNRADSINKSGWHPCVLYPYEKLFIGAKVLYLNDYAHIYVVHRIVGGWVGHWVVKGDANPTSDRGYLTKDNYVGVVF